MSCPLSTGGWAGRNLGSVVLHLEAVAPRVVLLRGRQARLRSQHHDITMREGRGARERRCCHHKRAAFVLL